MTSKHKRKGASFELAVYKEAVETFGDSNVHRPRLTHDDQGDIVIKDFVLECKNYSDVSRAMREALQQAASEKTNADRNWGVGVVKRKGVSNVQESYVVMYLKDFFAVLKEIYDD